MEYKTLSESTTKQRQLFACGKEELDEFIRDQAQLHEERNLAKTYIAIEKNILVGFYSINAATAKRKQVNSYKNIKYTTIPAVLIGRLARKEGSEYKGYGSDLLMSALEKIKEISKVLGVAVVIVDSKEDTIGFYEELDFTRIGNTHKLYLLTSDLENLS